MAKKNPFAKKNAAVAAKSAKGVSVATSKTHRTVAGKGKVSTTTLKHGMNSRQAGC